MWPTLPLVSREQARDSYVAQYDENDLYANLDPSIFRHRFVIHLQDDALLSETVEALRQVDGLPRCGRTRLSPPWIYHSPQCGQRYQRDAHCHSADRVRVHHFQYHQAHHL